MNRKLPTIIPPLGGWKARTYYIVEVCFNKNNPCFGPIFHTGFLSEDGKPCNYNYITCGSMDQDESNTIDNVVFMPALQRICDDDKLREIPNHWKLPNEVDTQPFDETKTN